VANSGIENSYHVKCSSYVNMHQKEEKISLVVNVVVNIRDKKRSYISVTPSFSELPLLFKDATIMR